MGCNCSKNNDMSKGLDKSAWPKFQFNHEPYKGEFTPFFAKLMKDMEPMLKMSLEEQTKMLMPTDIH